MFIKRWINRAFFSHAAAFFTNEAGFVFNRAVFLTL